VKSEGGKWRTGKCRISTAMENAGTNNCAEYNMYNHSQLLKTAFAGYYRHLAFTAKNVLKPCPHWRLSSEMVTICHRILSPNSATVAEFGATVAIFDDSLPIRHPQRKDLIE